MSYAFYWAADKFFFVFHTSLILFNLFGWLWRRTRPWNLATLLLTGASWTVLGIWYGPGFCPFTHWHWLVRVKLGRPDMPSSYIKFLLDSLTGLDFNERLVDTATLVFYLMALCLSLFFNLRDFLRSRTGG